MSIFSADELAAMRETVEATLEDTCSRRRYTDGAVDDYGNPTRTSTDTTLPCRKVPAPGNEATVDRDVQTHEASFLFEHGADVVGGDELIHGGDTWQVLGPSVTQSWPTHLRVLVRRSEAL